MSAYPTSEARVIIKEELGSLVDSICSEFSFEPVAAVSLARVYKAKFRSSGEKVGVVAPWLKRIFELNTNIVGIIDTWGAGVFTFVAFEVRG